MQEETNTSEVFSQIFVELSPLKIVVIDKAEFHFEAEKFEVKDGDVLMFKKDDNHKVLAVKDTKFLLARI